MKSRPKGVFGEILKSLALINSQTLSRKAELAASLARLCPRRRERLLTIEQSALDQLNVINRLMNGSTLGRSLAVA